MRKNTPDIAADNRMSRQVMRYTILFLITALCTYALFIVLPRTFLSNADGNVDGIAQQYPIYSEIKRMIHALLTGAGWESWSWDIGLGDDAFIEFSTRLFNPLTYLVIAFPQKYLDLGFTLMVLIMQYLSGLSFMLLGRKVNFDYRQNITGGLCYAFSGWVIQSIMRQGTFLMATILFPLLILGAEKIVRKESPLVFIFAVAAHVLYSMQWTYIGAITIVMYYVVRMITGASAGYAEICTDRPRYERAGITGMPAIERKDIGGITAVFIASGIAGIIMPGVILLDTISRMRATTTASTVESQTLYSIAEYLGMPTGLFMTTPTTEAYTVLGLPSVCIILLPLIVRSVRKKSAPAVMTVILLVLSLLPFTGRVFNGMSYSVGRWYYVLAFFMVWSVMEWYRPETFRETGEVAGRSAKRIMTWWIAGLAVWGLGVCWLLLGITDLTGAASIVMGTATGLLLIRLLFIGGLEEPADESAGTKRNRLLVTAMIVVGIVSYVNTELFPGLGESIHTLCQVGRIESDFSDSTQRVGPAVQAEDTSFYRIDQVDGYTDARIARVRANENMYWGNRSVYTYLSTMESRWHEWCRLTGNNAGYFDRTTVYSNDNREGLDFLTGVKYFLGDSTTKKPGANDYAAYGYTPYKEIDGVQVLKNKYCMGLGTAFDKYITESELEKYTPLEREQVMLQAAVISDEDAAENGGADAPVQHAAAGDIKTDIRVTEVGLSDFDNIDAEGLTAAGTGYAGNKGGTLTVHKDASFSIDLPQTEKARVMIAFEGWTRDKSDFDTDLTLKGKDFKGNPLAHAVQAASYEDNEKFKLELSCGNIVKAAQMRKGKNQGYSDVKDFYVNLGYFDSISGKIKVDIDRPGVYHFDSVRAYIVPMDIYDEAAQKLEKSAVNISSFDGREVSGTVSAEKASVLYFSILDQPGWKLYIDGKETERFSRVDTAFMGAVIPAGNHEIKLTYRTPFMMQGALLTAAGLAAAAFLTIRAKRRSKTGAGIRSEE